MNGGVRGLALGTAQFGLAYGVAGREESVPADEARTILELAARRGIRVLDTAPAYGDIEARLVDLAGDLGFGIVSKISPVVGDADTAAATVRASVARSITRLGGHLTTLLFHRADDLLAAHGDGLWRAAADAAGPQVRIGVSAYDPQTIATLRERYPITVAQLPANALDQRLHAEGMAAALDGVELHARSVFLQGLLLIPAPAAARRVPAAASAHARWVSWCRGGHADPVTAALAIARGLPGVRLCVLGVDRVSQLDEILSAAAAAPRVAPELACDDPDVIDPRRWPAA